MSREYRNRRIGDFLKELGLTEGRGTGFPAIYNAMENNGSPKPKFETNEQSTHVLATLPVHELALNNDQDNTYVFSSIEDIIAFCDQVSDQAVNQVNVILNDQLHNRVKDVLEVVTEWIKRADLFKKMNLSNHSTNREKYLDPLINLRWIEMEYPDKRTSPKQRYKNTESGKRLLGLLKRKN